MEFYGSVMLEIEKYRIVISGSSYNSFYNGFNLYFRFFVISICKKEDCI